MYRRKSVGPRMKPRGTPALLDILVKTCHPDHNLLKLSNTGKRRNNAKYLTLNSIRLKSVKKTSILTLSKALYISSDTARLALDLLKVPAILSGSTVRRSAVDREDLKP